MILYINGSPKLKNSNSEYFLNLISKSKDKVYLYKDNFEAINFENYSTIVLSFPLYLDSPPSKVIELMEYIIDFAIDISNKNIYVICNCGFLEPLHNFSALQVIENFCIKNRALYKGYLAIGAGEIIGKSGRIKIYKVVSLPFILKIKKFKKSIENSKVIYLHTTIHPMTKNLYIKLANKSWNKKIKYHKNIYEK